MVFDQRFLAKSDSQAYPPYRFTYITSDTGATVQASGYFNDAALKLNVGDSIRVIADDVVGDVQVVSNAAGVVDCSNFVAVPVADSD